MITKNNVQSGGKVRFLKALSLVALVAGMGWATGAQAAGTAAGTTISNTATATYKDPGGNSQSATSNTVDIKVDELIDVTVVSADPADVVTAPGVTNQVLAFTVTNTGNGSETFTLAANGTLGGDNFDPTTTSIVIDSNNNGVYDAGVDTVYTPGTNDPVLAADGSVTVFVLSTIPGNLTDGSRGLVNLTATSNTGTGAPGKSFAGQGDGGGDAVLGTTGGDGVDDGAFVVSNAVVTLAKSAVVADPFGGTESVPGSIITYTLAATITGSATLSNLAIGDVIPTGTTYQPGTITLQGSGLSDANGDDAGTFTGSAISVALGSVAGGSTRTVTFQVKIN